MFDFFQVLLHGTQFEFLMPNKWRIKGSKYFITDQEFKIILALPMCKLNTFFFVIDGVLDFFRERERKRVYQLHFDFECSNWTIGQEMSLENALKH